MITFEDFKKLPLTKLLGTLPLEFVEEPDDGLDIRIYYDNSVTKHKGVISYHRGTEASGDMLNTSHELVTSIVNRGYMLVYTSYWSKLNPYGYHNLFPNYSSNIGLVEQQSFVEGIFKNIEETDDIKNRLPENFKILLAGHSKGAVQVLQWSNVADINFPMFKDRIIGVVANSPSGGGTGTSWAQPYKFPRVQGAIINGVTHPTKVLLPCGDTTHLIRDFAELYFRFITNSKVDITVFGDSAFYTHAWISKDYTLWAKVLCDFYDSLTV